MSLPEPTEKTWQDRIEEKLDAYRQAGMDEHSLNIYRFQMEREGRRQQAGVSAYQNSGKLFAERPWC
jgi:hypothetical protein